MSFANRHKKGSRFDVDITNWPYHKLEELKIDGTVYTIQGLYISTKGKFGDQPVAICDNFCVNLPAHMTDEVKEILSSDEDVEDIKAGVVGFTVEQYVDKKFGKTCYGINWADVE